MKKFLFSIVILFLFSCFKQDKFESIGIAEISGFMYRASDFEPNFKIESIDRNDLQFLTGKHVFLKIKQEQFSQEELNYMFSFEDDLDSKTEKIKLTCEVLKSNNLDNHYNFIVKKNSRSLHEMLSEDIKNKDEVSFLFFKKGGGNVETFFVDSTYLAVVKYKGDLDSITEKVYKKGYPERQLYYYNLSNQELDLASQKPSFLQENYTYDTIYARDSKTFFFEVEFKREGDNYINGIIDDFVYMKEKVKTIDTSKIRLISNKAVVSKNIYVNSN